MNYKSRQREKHKITQAEAERMVPHDPFYCEDSGHCPFHCFRKFTKSKYKKLATDEIILQYPSPYLEWCSLLKKPLYVQDGLKDCGINCDEPCEDLDADEQDTIGD